MIRGKLLAVVAIIVIVVAVVAAYAVLNLMPQACELELVSYKFTAYSSGWRFERAIEVTLKNVGENNATISSIKVNDKDVYTWNPRWIVIHPGEIKTIYIFYPWKGEECNIKIETNVGVLEFKDKSPSFKGYDVYISNPYSFKIDEIYSINLHFADGECKANEIKVVDENGNEVLSQVWGILKYDSGYIKTATVSFKIEIEAYGARQYSILIGEQPTATGGKIDIYVERVKGSYTIVDNGALRIRFNETGRWHGCIDYFGSKDVNFAKIFYPKGAHPPEGLAFYHGLLDSMLDSEGKMYAVIQKTDIYIESEGPLLYVYTRKWKLKLLGYAYEFYAIPKGKSYIVYKFAMDVSREFGVGPGAGKPAPSEPDYRYYNPHGVGGMSIPHLSVVTGVAGLDAPYFLLDTGDIYDPLYPGIDIWVMHPVAACRDYDLGVGISILCNDPTHPIWYWHITTQKFPWFEWGASAESLRDDPAGDLSSISGVDINMLCYHGQDPSREPYALETEVVPRGGVLFREGYYSWVFVVRAMIHEDVLSTLKTMKDMYLGLEVSVNYRS
ncbi:MAG TPA: hypothetical protein ENF53_03450 [Thermoprotei archaeon]|nr:hypothetical protein [Thermoprotei archaeon]